MFTNPATPCVPPCVAMFPQALYPQVREMGRGAPGRPSGPPASPEFALLPGWPCSPAEGASAEGFSVDKGAGHPASKTLGTATIPSQRSLPESARFADEHPIQNGAPGAPLILTP